MIPLSIPNLNGNEWQYVKNCIETNWISSVGSYVNLFEEKLAEFVGAKYAIACVNGTAALHISLLLAGVKKETHVIVPNITFVAPVNAIKYCNANPILIDVEPDSWQMDLQLVRQFFEKETILKNGRRELKTDGKEISAIVPVHVLGNMVDMEELVRIGEEFGVPIVEDATESLGAYFKGKHAGTFGRLGCFSFNGNKIMTTGGGGMIVIDDEALARRAKHLTTQAKQDPLEYVHDEIGYNYRLVNLLAAVGVAQLEQMPTFLQKKKEIANLYSSTFSQFDFIQPQVITKGVESNHWLYTVQLPKSRELLKHLAEQKIQSRPLWCPMNRLEMFKKNIYYTKRDVSGKVYKSCLSLPCSTNLQKREQAQVQKQIVSFYSLIDAWPII